MSSSSIGRDAEWEIRDHLEKQGWIVIRSAASRVIDLIAIRQGDELFIEVKSTAEPTFRLSRSVQGTQQLRDHISYAMLIGATPYYCVKFRKSGKWVISNAEMVSSIVREQDGKSLEEWKP